MLDRRKTLRIIIPEKLLKNNALQISFPLFFEFLHARNSRKWKREKSSCLQFVDCFPFGSCRLMMTREISIKLSVEFMWWVANCTHCKTVVVGISQNNFWTSFRSVCSSHFPLMGCCVNNHLENDSKLTPLQKSTSESKSPTTGSRENFSASLIIKQRRATQNFRSNSNKLRN